MRTKATTAALAALFLSSTTTLAADPAVKCEASKNKTAGSYYACREKAEAKAITKGEAADYTKCSAKFVDKWDKAEAKGEGACPDTVALTADMDSYLAAQAAETALIISGSLATIPDCAGDLTACEGDLASCEASLGVPKTGQTTCWDPGDTSIPIDPLACAGSGQDGDVQSGAAPNYTDNLDGTITDNATGLMWEKISDDGSIHDKDTTYTWANALSGKIATLNSSTFAGYGDWRLPNVKELQSLQNFGVGTPATFPEFDDSCSASCTVLTCSCTRTLNYWSSTTRQNSPNLVWIVSFGTDGTTNVGKGGTAFVRAVRGGS